jgi:hypothetical protein
MTWAVLNSPEKGPSARLRREARIELRSSTRLGSPHNRAPCTPRPRPAPLIPSSFLSLSFPSSPRNRSPFSSPDRTGRRPPPERPPPATGEAARHRRGRRPPPERPPPDSLPEPARGDLDFVHRAARTTDAAVLLAGATAARCSPGRRTPGCSLGRRRRAAPIAGAGRLAVEPPVKGPDCFTFSC